MTSEKLRVKLKRAQCGKGAGWGVDAATQYPAETDDVMHALAIYRQVNPQIKYVSSSQVVWVMKKMGWTPPEVEVSND